MILLLVLASIGLTACTNNEEKLNDSEMFKKEYESFNDKENDYFKYRNLSIVKIIRLFILLLKIL